METKAYSLDLREPVIEACDVVSKNWMVGILFWVRVAGISENGARRCREKDRMKRRSSRGPGSGDFPGDGIGKPRMYIFRKERCGKGSERVAADEGGQRI